MLPAELKIVQTFHIYRNRSILNRTKRLVRSKLIFDCLWLLLTLYARHALSNPKVR